MSFLNLAHDRYSCRSFSDRPVEQEKIDTIIEAGRVAPTAVNFQPAKIWVFKSKEALEKLYQTVPFPFVKQAQVVFVIGGDPESAWKRHFDGKNFADVDSSIIATHMMLEIQDLGLGTTWVGHFNADKLAELFPEMKGYNLTAMFPVGYPADNAAPSNTHTVYKPMDEMVSIF